MNRITVDPWACGEWRHRLVDAAMHRYEAGIANTEVWRDYSLTARPTTKQQWQYTLFFAAGSGMEDITALALAEGASASETIYASTGQPAYAFLWKDTISKTTERSVHIATPIQAAMAGASQQCIHQIANGGAVIDDALEWITGIPCCLPRIQGGLTLIEVMLHRADNMVLYEPLLKPWITRSLEYLTKMLNNHHRNQKEIDRIVAAAQRITLVSHALYAQLTPKNEKNQK